MKEYNVERAWRDLRLNRIGAGTDEIMLEVIGALLRAVGLDADAAVHRGARGAARVRARLHRARADPARRRSGRTSAGSPTRSSRKLAAQGLLGLKYPAEYGGQGGDYLHEAVLCEEMARIGSGGTAAGIGAHINIATPPIWKFGTEEQKQRYLVPGDRAAS